MAWKRVAEEWAVGLVMVAGALTAFSGLLVLIVQVLRWLKFGVWTPTSIGSAVRAIIGDLPTVSWVGVQRIADGLWDQPLSLGLMVTGGLLYALGGALLVRGQVTPPE